MSKKVAVILVNFKGYAERFLVECRDSLRAQDYPKELIRIYIVDNASSEGSRGYLAEAFPEAVVVPRDDGNYAAANNAGIKKGREDGCEHFVIANMDVKFDPGWLSELVRAADENPEAGIVQSKILLYPKTEDEWKKPRVNTLGNVMHYLGFGFTDGYGEEEKIPPPPLDKGGIGYASGCSMLVKKEVLDKIGGYNEEYHMYHDDVELSWKAKLAGYKIILAPESVVYHKYEFDRSVRMLYYMERNRYLAVFTYYKLETIIFIAPALLIMDLGMLFYSIARGWFKTKMGVYAYFLNPATWTKISGYRREAEKIRTKTDKDLAGCFSGEVLFQEIDNPLLKYIGNPLLGFYWKIIKPLIKW